MATRDKLLNDLQGTAYELWGQLRGTEALALEIRNRLAGDDDVEELARAIEALASPAAKRLAEGLGNLPPGEG